MSFNGGWADNLECVNATNRKPLLEVTTDGQTVMYDDKTSEIALTSLFICRNEGRQRQGITYLATSPSRQRMDTRALSFMTGMLVMQ